MTKGRDERTLSMGRDREDCIGSRFSSFPSLSLSLSLFLSFFLSLSLSFHFFPAPSITSLGRPDLYTVVPAPGPQAEHQLQRALVQRLGQPRPCRIGPQSGSHIRPRCVSCAVTRAIAALPDRIYARGMYDRGITASGPVQGTNGRVTGRCAITGTVTAWH